MKTTKSKKLNKQIDTICDFNSTYTDQALGETSNTDSTVTMTIITTTINTQTGLQKLGA